MDTHAIFKNLVNSGLTDKQSEVIVSIIRDSRSAPLTNDTLEATFERHTRVMILAVTGIVFVLNAVLFVALRFA